jgi:anti-sigma B factor antagonist
MLDYYDSEIDLLGDLVVLTVTGETDLATAPQFRRDLDEAMEVTSGDLILDLKDLELIESTALGIMMAAASRMMTERRSLVLVVSRTHVLRVFEITGLLSFFSIAATRVAAMTRVSSARISRKVA